MGFFAAVARLLTSKEQAVRLASAERSPNSASLVPAPWTLRAEGYVLLLKLPSPCGRAELFASSELADARFGPYAWALFVDYHEAPVGPYHELLLIPGRFRFGARRLPSITKIYVSSQASVDNGRHHWGIPKELASFKLTRERGRVERIDVRVDGRPAVELAFRSGRVGLPVASWLLPIGLRTLGQTLGGRTFEVSPSAHALAHRADVLDAWSDPALFAALSPDRILAAARLTKLHLTVPKAVLR